MKTIAKVITSTLLVITPFLAKAQASRLNMRVNTDSVVYTIKGGIGASWHAMTKDYPPENDKYDYPVKSYLPRGSAYAGNPPLSDTAAWVQLYKHASWLGLNFVRVELSQRMYEPERNVFDWNNEEMKVLYKILDWCEANHADVFLQQMWSDVVWNAYPGVHPLISAPYSLDDYAEGIFTLLQHLTKTKKYSCIKYFCITNEPPGGAAGTWGYWWNFGYHFSCGGITPALQKVREVLDAKGINIPLSGPDWCRLSSFDESKIDFDKYIGAYDAHSYEGIDDRNDVFLSKWILWAHQHNKPFFISEIGNMNLGWGGDNPAPKSFAASLSNASDVICGLNKKADGFNRWSFVNRGNIDGQWQMVNTYDNEKKTYNTAITPVDNSYYGYGILTRFLGKHASTLALQTENDIDSVKQTAFRNLDGNIVVLFVNNKKNAVDVSLTMKAVSPNKPFQLYQLTEALLMQPDFRLDPVKKITGFNKPRTFTLLPKSIAVITTYNFRQEDAGVKTVN